MKSYRTFHSRFHRFITPAALLSLALSTSILAKDDDEDNRDKKKKTDEHHKVDERHKPDVKRKEEPHHSPEVLRKMEEHHKPDVKHSEEPHHSPEVLRKMEEHHIADVHSKNDVHHSPEVIRKEDSHHVAVREHHSHLSEDQRRKVFFAYSRKHYRVSYGDGYQGRGYYYGPVGASYYFEGPGIVFYRERRLVPQEYSSVDDSYNLDNVDTRVQRALALRGYYNGDIDGDIGPGSRSAISHFQSDNDLRPTGTINASLLDALDVEE